MKKPYRNLDLLMKPSSIALIGASLSEGSYGYHLLRMLVDGGYKGKIYPINPKYVQHSNKIKFYENISSLPEIPDQSVIALKSNSVERALIDSIESGSKSLTIFADTSSEKFHKNIQLRLEKERIEICGSNSMGFHNLIDCIRVSPFGFPLDLIPGNISLIVQSGSVLGALLNNDRRLRYNYIISSGAEIFTSASEYLFWTINQPSTKVVGLFLEGIRNPSEFISSLILAKSKNIPVVILKVGKTEASSKLALSHTGALVGNYEVFKAVMEENGAHLVDTIDEMAASLQVFSLYNNTIEGKGIASIHDSGGERELIVDLAEEIEVPYAVLSRNTKTKISKVLEPTMKPENPLDAWGSGHQADILFEKSFLFLIDDPSVSIGLYVMDWRQDYYLHLMHEKVLNKVLPQIKKPLIAVSNYSLTNDQDLAIRFLENGIPLIKGTREALIAVKNLMNHQTKLVNKDYNLLNKKKYLWLKKLAKKKILDTIDGFNLLKDYKIASPLMKEVFSFDHAISFANKVKYPLVLKTSNKEIQHKTEVNGVITNINSPKELKLSFEDLNERLGEGVIVSEMINEGIELSLGIINDIDFGPAVLVSAGGTLIELIDDKVVFPSPISSKEVRKKINKLKISKLFNGYRGSEKININMLCQLISNFSQLAWDFKDLIEEVDINPLIVNSRGIYALDCLIILKNNS